MLGRQCDSIRLCIYLKHNQSSEETWLDTEDYIYHNFAIIYRNAM